MKILTFHIKKLRIFIKVALKYLSNYIFYFFKLGHFSMISLVEHIGTGIYEFVFQKKKYFIRFYKMYENNFQT